MRFAMEHLELDALFVLYPGLKRYTLADRIEVLPATTISEFTGRGSLPRGLCTGQHHANANAAAAG